MLELISSYQDFLDQKKLDNCFRSLKLITKRRDQYIWQKEKKLIDFSSNNYLGLGDKSFIVNSQWGNGACASRLLTGNFSIYQDLEEKISQWKGFEKSLFFASGYQANIGMISALADKKTEIFSDKLNHASIIDGIILSKAKLNRFPHLDYFSLEKKLKKNCSNKKIIISESIFSMDGDKADIKRLSFLAKKYDALLIIDDAHGSGIFGESGKGFANSNLIDVYMATFSKALGSFGAVVCSNKIINQYLINCCRSFIYTTAPPPMLIKINIEAVNFIQTKKAE